MPEKSSAKTKLIPVAVHSKHVNLTKKQERFLREYVKGYKPREAALRAGYSKRMAARANSELLSLPHMVARLEEIEEEIRERNKVTEDYFVAELKAINEAEDSKGKRINRTSDRIAALALLAKITGHIKEKPVDQKDNNFEKIELIMHDSIPKFLTVHKDNIAAISLYMKYHFCILEDFIHDTMYKMELI